MIMSYVVGLILVSYDTGVQLSCVVYGRWITYSGCRIVPLEE